MTAIIYPVTRLDAELVLQHAYDETTQSLRTTATIDTSGGDVEVAINHLEDSVRLGDGTDFFTSTIIGSDRALDVYISGGTLVAQIGGLDGPLNNDTIPVTDTATKIPASALLDRETITIRILNQNTVYFGDSGVTSSNGYPKYRREEIVLDVTDALDVYAICESGKTNELRFIELAS